MYKEYGSYFLGFIPNPFVRYVISDDRAHIKRGVGLFGWFFWDLGPATTIPIQSANIGKSPYKLSLGFFGDIEINDSNNSLIWKDVWGLKSKYNFLNSYSQFKTDNEIKEKTESFAQNNHGVSIEEQSSTGSQQKTRSIPNEVEFSDRVILLPRPAGVFSHILHVHNRGYPIWEKPELKKRWVEKGDVLYTLAIRKTRESLWKESEWYEFPIKSPVAGLVVPYGKVKFYSHEEDIQYRRFNYYCILLPEGGLPYAKGDILYQDFYRFCLSFVPENIANLHEKDASRFIKRRFEKAGIDITNASQVKEYLREEINKTPSDPIISKLTGYEFIDSFVDMLNAGDEASKKLAKFELPKAYFDIARDLMDRGDFVYAINYFAKASPIYTDAMLYSQALFINALGDEFHAKNCFHSSHASVLEKAPKVLEKAKKGYLKAIEINPEHGDAINRLKSVEEAIESKTYNHLIDRRIYDVYIRHRGIDLADAKALSFISQEWWPSSWCYGCDRLELDERYSEIGESIKDQKLVKDLEEEYGILCKIARPLEETKEKTEIKSEDSIENKRSSSWKNTNYSEKDINAEEARIRWGLPPEYTKEILDNFYIKYKNSGKFSSKQLSEDYVLLEESAS
tara:strand:- start:1266 stop:3137 length:1872 start_codon:yes stop_codon:yes gene_type:complete